MKKVRPFEQGELDGLCGIYSIINAVRRIRGGKILKDIDERNELFLEILNYLHKHYHGLVFMIDGISIQSIAGILRDIIEPKYNITRKRPAPDDADEHKGEDGKFDKYFSPEPGTGP